MIQGCPNIDCTHREKNTFVMRDGQFFRKDDSRWIQRYRCRACGKRFSTASHSQAFRQRKRRKNRMLWHLLSSNVSMRRAALILGIHRITVARKLEYLALLAAQNQEQLLARKAQENLCTHMQFDDLITHEHTKLKPLTVTVAVDADTRQILSAEVNVMGAFGKIAVKSRQKYGIRKSQHRKGIIDLFTKIQHSISPEAEIRSDLHWRYKPRVNEFFPNAKYKQYKGKKAQDDGQGELKSRSYDPLFYINHTLGMLRANVNRLIRRTWCTTKLAERLAMHIAVYIDYHNHELI